MIQYLRNLISGLSKYFNAVEKNGDAKMSMVTSEHDMQTHETVAVVYPASGVDGLNVPEIPLELFPYADKIGASKSRGRNDGKLEQFLTDSGLVPLKRFDEYPESTPDYREWQRCSII